MPALEPRKKATQARAQATIEAILDAAAHILIKEGLDGVTTNHIAEEAGVSVGSLYQYFPNKEAIVYALVERHVHTMQALLEDMAIKYAEAPLEEAVPAYVRAMYAAHRVQPKLHQVFSEQLTRLAGRDALHRWQEHSQAIVRGYLENHRPRLRPKDLDMAAFVLVHAVESVTYGAALARPRYFEKDGLAEEVSQLVLRYLVAPTQA